MLRVATKDHIQHEDTEAERLVRKSPKKKPPRTDKRRERMDVDVESEADLDLSLNYKVVGAVAARYARKVIRVPARNKETGDIVQVSPQTLQESGRYEKLDPDEDATGDGDSQKEAPPSENSSVSDKAEGAESSDEEGKAESSDEEGKADKVKANPTLAEKLGIEAPPQREVSTAERVRGSMLLADTLPPKLAAELITQRMHPDDVQTLVDTFKAQQARKIGNLSTHVEKLSQLYQTDPDQVEPPLIWMVNGKKTSFADLEPEVKAQAYRKHQLQIVGMSLAARGQLEQKLAFEGAFAPEVTVKMATAILEGKEGSGAKVFDSVSRSKALAQISEAKAKQILKSIGGFDVGSEVVRAALEAHDYQMAKDLYLKKGQFSERDKASTILKGLIGSRDFFAVQGVMYGDSDSPHRGAAHFETKVLEKLKKLAPEKYDTVRLALDQIDARAYDKAVERYEKELKRPATGESSFTPTPPVKPAGYSNGVSPETLRVEGQAVWNGLLDRTTSKQVAKVASKFVTSTYLNGNAMSIDSHRQPKVGLYHGIDPVDNYPPAYPRGGQIPIRDIGPSDEESILATATEWLATPLLDGVAENQRYREALDRSLGGYKLDIQAYNNLLARLEDSPASAVVERFFAAASNRETLERAVFRKFPPDSKLKRGGKLRVMLTGTSASKLGEEPYTTVTLSDLKDSDLKTLAGLFNIKTSSFTGTVKGVQTPQTNNGADMQSRLSSDQKKIANTILTRLDKVAEAIMSKHASWGLPQDVAKDLVNSLDRTADETESLVYGPESLRRRQAEVAVSDESFAKAAREEIGRAAFEKAAAVLQRDSDEPYMDTFQNPMGPVETNADEPYMQAYGDDQSSAVNNGKDDTGRKLAP